MVPFIGCSPHGLSRSSVHRCNRGHAMSSPRVALVPPRGSISCLEGRTHEAVSLVNGLAGGAKLVRGSAITIGERPPAQVPRADSHQHRSSARPPPVNRSAALRNACRAHPGDTRPLRGPRARRARAAAPPVPARGRLAPDDYRGRVAAAATTAHVRQAVSLPSASALATRPSQHSECGVSSAFRMRSACYSAILYGYSRPGA